MAIPSLMDDVEIISKLGTNPGTDNGLSEEQLKSKFDEAAVIIKNFINNTLIPNVNKIIDLDVLIDKTLSKSGHAADAQKTGEEIKNAKTAADEAKTAAGKALDDSKAYTDSKHLPLTATITTEWTGDTAPFTQTVAVEGILKEDWPHVMPVYSEVLETALAEKEAWACVSDAKTVDGSIVFICFEDKPTTAITIQIEVNR